MELQVSDVADGTIKILLTGRLDVPGVDQIETRFSALTVASRKNSLIDLSGVSFIASMGIRMLINAARGMQLKNTRMVLFGATELVQEVLDNVSLGDIIPVASGEAQALERLGL